MIIRLARWNVLPEYEREAVERWNLDLLPRTYARCNDLISAHFLGDPHGPERIAATVWRSADAYAAALGQGGVLTQIADEFRAMYVEGQRPIASTYTHLAGRRYAEDCR
ncbi:hypothetical protein ACFQE5_02575 [Pseudonocardia hispaniensis]|uniref:Antibiotic biosynthesis monooxygenase n=1 Tax=Pseudonocardia hispaniensis TaxID=904933 RepID=A0ABW1IX87_9PSEU